MNTDGEQTRQEWRNVTGYISMKSRTNYVMKNSLCQLYAWHLKNVCLIGSISSQSRKFKSQKSMFYGLCCEVDYIGLP